MRFLWAPCNEFLLPAAAIRPEHLGLQITCSWIPIPWRLWWISLFVIIYCQNSISASTRPTSFVRFKWKMIFQKNHISEKSFHFDCECHRGNPYSKGCKLHLGLDIKPGIWILVVWFVWNHSTYETRHHLVHLYLELQQLLEERPGFESNLEENTPPGVRPRYVYFWIQSDNGKWWSVESLTTLLIKGTGGVDAPLAFVLRTLIEPQRVLSSGWSLCFSLGFVCFSFFLEPVGWWDPKMGKLPHEHKLTCLAFGQMSSAAALKLSF